MSVREDKKAFGIYTTGQGDVLEWCSNIATSLSILNGTLHSYTMT